MKNWPQSIYSMGLALLFIACAIMGCGVNKGLINYDIGFTKFEDRELDEAMMLFQQLAQERGKEKLVEKADQLIEKEQQRFRRHMEELKHGKLDPPTDAEAGTDTATPARNDDRHPEGKRVPSQPPKPLGQVPEGNGRTSGQETEGSP